MDKYFKKFPTISYSNTLIRDITRRVKFTDNYQNVPNLFYPVEINAGLRADLLAEAVYKDSELDWLIYHTNHVVDPYYHWYLSEDQFNQFLIDKYGSYELPRKKIKYYRNNWYEDDNTITVDYYNNILPLDEKQYYDPNYGPTSKIISYSRKKHDWTTNTNKIIQYTISSYTSGNAFTEGEILDIWYTGEIVGGCEAITSNSTHLIVQHVSGNSIANSTWTKTIIGETSNTQATLNNYEILQENITNADARFWSAITYYDWELEENEKKKHLYILNETVVPRTSLEIKKLLND